MCQFNYNSSHARRPSSFQSEEAPIDLTADQSPTNLILLLLMQLFHIEKKDWWFFPYVRISLQKSANVMNGCLPHL
ncbi:hypothetical protein M758_10G144600 [Ceratodon purpureus]|nr:hypothetical protein M758_10G144600 [Ceratodon purpureus]